MKTLFDAIGATIKAFFLWVWIMFVGALFVSVPIAILISLTLFIVKLFTM